MALCTPKSSKWPGPRPKSAKTDIQPAPMNLQPRSQGHLPLLVGTGGLATFGTPLRLRVITSTMGRSGPFSCWVNSLITCLEQAEARTEKEYSTLPHVKYKPGLRIYLGDLGSRLLALATSGATTALHIIIIIITSARPLHTHGRLASNTWSPPLLNQ